MRVFCAFPVNDESKAAIEPYTRYGMERYGHIKWVEPSLMHITLFFFGDISMEENGMMESVKSKLADLAAGYPPFHAEFHGLGQFPPKGDPRVVFVPLLRGKEECRRIYETGHFALKKNFDLGAGRYSPHITVGRGKRGRKGANPTRDKHFGSLNGKFRINEIILYESVLQPDGPVYNEIASFALQNTV